MKNTFSDYTCSAGTQEAEQEVSYPFVNKIRTELLLLENISPLPGSLDIKITINSAVERSPVHTIKGAEFCQVLPLGGTKIYTKKVITRRNSSSRSSNSCSDSESEISSAKLSKIKPMIVGEKKFSNAKAKKLSGIEKDILPILKLKSIDRKKDKRREALKYLQRLGKRMKRLVRTPSSAKPCNTSEPSPQHKKSSFAPKMKKSDKKVTIQEPKSDQKRVTKKDSRKALQKFCYNQSTQFEEEKKDRRSPFVKAEGGSEPNNADSPVSALNYKPGRKSMKDMFQSLNDLASVFCNPNSEYGKTREAKTRESKYSAYKKDDREPIPNPMIEVARSHHYTHERRYSAHVRNDTSEPFSQAKDTPGSERRKSVCVDESVLKLYPCEEESRKSLLYIDLMNLKSKYEDEDAFSVEKHDEEPHHEAAFEIKRTWSKHAHFGDTIRQESQESEDEQSRPSDYHTPHSQYRKRGDLHKNKKVNESADGSTFTGGSDFDEGDCESSDSSPNQREERGKYGLFKLVRCNPNYA